MNMKTTVIPGTVLKETMSMCPVCAALVPAQVIKTNKDGIEKVVMERTCAQHGSFSFTVASDARFYWAVDPHPATKAASCGCGPCGCNPAPSASLKGAPAFLGGNLDILKHGLLEKLSTCVALIEIFDGCNMPCKTCFANAPRVSSGDISTAIPFEDIVARVQGVIDRKGKIEILQISGGEPTLHPEFFRVIEWARSNPKIEYLLINTNGLLLATNPQFIRQLGEMQRRFDNIQIYLQFDGPQKDGQVALRGMDPRWIREQAIINCGEVGVPITLAMVVTSETMPYLWDTVAFGLTHDHVRGVSFQPEFFSGRQREQYDPRALPEAITMADVALGLNVQSKGQIRLEDMTSLPCGDPNCAMIGWVFRMNGKYYSPAEYGIDIADLHAKIPDRINYRLEDLVKCGCEGTALGELMKKLEVQETNAFRIFIKPFMDARTWDVGRTDRCCTHVIAPDGRLQSFCAYYARGGAVAYRK